MILIRSICLSAHLDSFCRRLNELRGLEFCYQTDDPGAMRRQVGWKVEATYTNGPINADNTERAKHCELLIEMLREPNLIEHRTQAGLPTVYVCERWFKPISINLPIPLFAFVLRLRLKLPGHLRLLVPSYHKMARRFVALMDDPHVWFFPCGVHAVRDFVRLYKMLHGNLLAWFRQPKVEIERTLGGSVHGFTRIKLWGYFVEPSEKKSKCEAEVEEGERTTVNLNLQPQPSPTKRSLRVLWVGRMLDWKRVDVLIKAFKILLKSRQASLIIAGEGPERARLEKLAGVCRAEGLDWLPGKICFNNYIQSSKVRDLMRSADVYVMPSNAEEGWGAAVSDALVEGCPVISTYEAGSSATLLPEENLYHANSVRELVNLLHKCNRKMIKYTPVEWSGSNAAEKMLEVIE